MEYPILLQLLTLLMAHCIGDFSMQTEFLSTYKSIDVIVLAVHCIIYTSFIIFGLIGCCLINGVNIVLALQYKYITIIFITHFIIDYIKCRFIDVLEDDYELTDLEKDNADTNIFYLDQMLHLVVLGIVLALFHILN